MKKYFQLIAVMAIALVPLAAQAVGPSFIVREAYTTGTPYAGDLYITSGNITIDSRIGGDLFMAGGTLTMTGQAADDVAAIGGTINMLGFVGDDMRVAGGQVTINGTVTGDLLVAGGAVQILPGAVIGGSVYVVGGQVTINGRVDGDVHATVSSRLVMGSTAHVSGALTYRAPREMELADGATINGTVSYAPVSRMHLNTKTPKLLIAGVVAALMGVKMLALLGAVVLAVWIWRRQALEVLQEAKEQFGRSALHGAVFMILVPIAIVLLMISFVGIIPGALLALAYGGVMIVTKVLSGMFLGAWVQSATQKRSALQVTWVNAIGGLVLIELITLIPVLGWLARMAIMLALFGVLATRIQRRIS